MKNFFNDSEDSQEDKLTKEDKIQIIIKIVPILLIIVILLITFVVNKNKNQKPDETPQDVVPRRSSYLLRHRPQFRRQKQPRLLM